MQAERAVGIIIAFHGGRRGEGKSFLARNLAAAAQQKKQRVLLFDLDPKVKQDHFIAWSIKPEPTLADLSSNLSSFDHQTIKGYFPENKEGVTVVGLAQDVQQALSITSHTIVRALALFQQAYDIIILDGLRGWETLILELLDQSDRILMVCSPDLIGLKQAKQDSQLYQQYKFPLNKINLVLNRFDQQGAIAVEHFEKGLTGHPRLAVLPFFSQATEVINHHYNINRHYPNSNFSKAMSKMVQQLLTPITQTSDQGINSNKISASHLESKKEKTVTNADIKLKIHQALLDHESLKSLSLLNKQVPENNTELYEKVEAVVTSLIAIEAPELSNRDQREQLVKEIVDEALGLGPLEDLIRDNSITEIMVNHRDQIYIERNGKLSLSHKKFLNDKQLLNIIERIVAPIGRRIDESQPYVDARLNDGSRVNAIIPPLAIKGPCLTIRKFSNRRLTIKDLIAFETLPASWADFLKACVQIRKNIVIAGGTGSGKTTLLNVISSFIPEEERIVTIEDAAELDLQQAHVVTLEARPANIEGKGQVTIRDLVKNSLRMTPHRIVVGECRSGEALDMLQAMNTGHEGSLTTVHANSPQDSIARLETMVLMSGFDFPVKAIREQIAGAIDLIVQQTRLSDGSRKVTSIAEVINNHHGDLEIKVLFNYQSTGLDKNKKVLGQFIGHGYCPSFMNEFSLKGIELDDDLFKKTKVK